ncbi:hypothetical protein [Chromohalobacter sp. 296-RDG]|uniref:hypothetical protein n=1 Tax=Chromohalobacter sp. 296-RDG TaxID=2994062 RepID=UPI002469AC6F|nr:hypothetical protein [Chromohalobacter sp. 296-RDG]
MLIDEAVFCSGFWVVGDNKKRDLDHYKKLFPEALKMLSGGYLVFFYEDDWVKEEINKLAIENNVEVCFVFCAVQDLPMRMHACDFARLATVSNINSIRKMAKNRGRKEKGLKHYKREIQESGVHVYEDLLSIWFSKIFLVRKVVEEGLCHDAKKFAWMDISVSRFSGQRESWDFVNLKFPRADKVYHYPSKLRYQGKPLPLNASLMIGGKGVWQDLCSSFLFELESLKETPYPHDEETVLGSIWYKERKFFKCIGRMDYRKIRLEFYRVLVQVKRKALLR